LLQDALCVGPGALADPEADVTAGVLADPVVLAVLAVFAQPPSAAAAASPAAAAASGKCLVLRRLAEFSIR
jgi:hypothetical protein